MRTTKDVQVWLSNCCGVWIEPDSILWHWSKGTLWFIVVNQPKNSMLPNTKHGYVFIARTHHKDGTLITDLELPNDIPIEKTPAEFQAKFKSYGSPEGRDQAERLTEVLYLSLKSDADQKNFHRNDIADKLSVGLTNVEIVQFKEAATERLEAENYDELEMIKAIVSGNVDAVEKCIESGSYELDSMYSPLHLALIRGFSKLAASLIEAGADVTQPGTNGKTALHYAAEYDLDDPISTVTYLIDFEADVNAINFDRMTPLHFAALYGRCDIAKFLIEADAAIDCRNDTGDTPLHLAAENGHSEIVAMLIQSKARLNVTNDIGSTPLSYAREAAYPEIAEMLIHAGAREFVSPKKNSR